MYRFGITMRITNAVGYDEPRESIATDWSNYLISAFNESEFIFIPNIENLVIDYIDNLNIDVLILTGGDDLGVCKRRDNTEQIALKHALSKNIPVIAVCRGLQLVHTFYGGIIKKGNVNFEKNHKAKKHIVTIDGRNREVNSYHTNYLTEESVSNVFEVFARCNIDSTIEGLRNRNILAMMWHPERDAEVVEWNKLLIEKFLKNEK